MKLGKNLKEQLQYKIKDISYTIDKDNYYALYNIPVWNDYLKIVYVETRESLISFYNSIRSW